MGSTDVVAIAGIIGTLAGAALGAFIPWKIQKRQLEHEDKTRFHERRLDVYAKFMEAAQESVSAVATGRRLSAPGDAFIRVYETIRLVATPAVAGAALRVYRAVDDIELAQGAPTAAMITEYSRHVTAFIEAVRSEIGVGSRRESPEWKATTLARGTEETRLLDNE